VNADPSTRDDETLARELRSALEVPAIDPHLAARTFRRARSVAAGERRIGLAREWAVPAVLLVTGLVSTVSAVEKMVSIFVQS
jgi:hypothetical protein